MSSYNSPENLAHVKSIAETLEAYCNGDIYRDDSGNLWSVYTEGESYQSEDYPHDFWQYDEDAELWTRSSTGETSEDDPADNWEQCDIWQYFENTDIYNTEYRVSGPHDDPSSVCIMVACGGPNIYIDTKSEAVELYWWGDRASYPLSSDAAAAVDEYFTELWHC